MATSILTNDLLVGKVFNFISNKGFLSLSDLLNAPSPLATRLPTKDAVISWIKEHLSTDERFAVEEDHGKIVSVKIVSKVRMCLHYVESGTCPLVDGCKFWHVCKDYIEGNCEKKCTHGKSHDFQDEQNGGKTEQFGFGKLQSSAMRRIVALNYPQVCSAYVQGPCVDINCSCLHLCAGFLKKTCFNNFECNRSHNIRSDHNKSILKKYGLNSSLKEIYLLCNILLPKKTAAPTNTPGDNIKTAAEKHVSKSAQNNPGGKKCVNSGDISKPDLLITRTPLFKSQAGSQSQLHQSIPHSSLNLNFPTSPDEEEAETSCEDDESVNISEPCAVNLHGSQNRPKVQNVTRSEKPSSKNRNRSQLWRKKKMSQSLPHFTKKSVPQMQGVVSSQTEGGNPRHWVGKGRGMQSTSHQDGSQRPGNCGSDCSGFTPIKPLIECSLPTQSCEYPGEGAAENDDCASSIGLPNKQKRIRSRGRRRNSKTKNGQERNAEEETEFQVDPPNKGGCAPNYTFPKQPSQELPPKQDMSFPHPKQSQNASEEFGAVSRSSKAQKDQPQLESVKSISSQIEAREWQPPLPQKTMVSTDRGASTSCSVTSKMELVQISEKQVFECICKEFDCSVKLSDISGRADLFPNGKADAEVWFRKDARKNSFIITEGDNKEILEITAFSSKLRLCFNGSNCHKECSFFHVCRDFIAGCCKSGASCRHEHEFRNEKDKELVSSLKIFNSFTEEQLGCIFRASTPHVCLDYNAGKCQRGEKCTRIHMCKDFVRKRCRGTACSLDHDDAYETPHTKALAEKFRMSVLTLKRVIIVPQPPQGQLTDQGHVHQDGAVHICSDFILGQCRHGARCAKHHCALPYQWQYRSQEGAWITCDGKDNESLERNYCDPSNGDNIKMNFNKTPFHTAGVCKMVVDFEGMTMLWPPLSYCPIQMRRLSTESNVMNYGNPLATTWTWYWQDEDSLWEKYGSLSGSERDVQCRIETAFLDPSNNWYDYSTSEHPYVLYFRDKTKGLYQKNQRYDTVRKIRRRPEFRSTDEIEQLKKKSNQHRKSSRAPQASDEQHPGLPSHWSRMSQGVEFERVTLPHNSQEFTKVKKLFHRTMSEEEKIIIEIERVQNPYMWDKFARKRQNMKAKFCGSGLEKELFHGTDPGDIEKICKQNFDWRLHGKNASVYGQGSYFALNASYSDSYTQQADHNSSHFMFLANVLVGSYVKGNSSMRRPPPRNPYNPTSDLYDSCVDEKHNPEIFVVFDMDQCYPSYVIEYEEILQQYGVARRLYSGGSRSGTRSTSSWSAAGVRAASPSSAVQTTSSLGTSSRSPSSSSSGYQSAAFYAAASPSSISSNIQTGFNPSSSSSRYQSPTSYGASSRAATSSLAGASSVPSSRAAASPTTRDSWSSRYDQSLDDYAWPAASQDSSSHYQGSSYGRSTSPTQGNGASSDKKEECVVL